ncbi:MAG TPA: CocE/NonD family hydrolase, partial [Candidatus Binatia bacterium]|nr:CocE/NonD family hydrolase [Candidatus Binatia bacterium]
ATRAWPPAAPATRTLFLGAAGSLATEPRAEPAADAFEHRPTAGMRGGSLCWGAGHPPNGLARDLRLEADAGPTWTSEPLAEPLDILGFPVAILHVEATRPVATLVARLGCVLPDGSIEQVSEGILNLTHRDSHAEPAPLEPGHAYEVRLQLRSAGYRFPRGHRIHLGLASAHWPVHWPSPGAGELTIHHGGDTPSRLELPLAPGAVGDPADADAAEPPAFGDPPTLPEIGSETSEPPRWEIVEHDGEGRVSIHEAATTTLPDGASTLYVSETIDMAASKRAPGTGRFENSCEYRLRSEGHDIDVVADGTTIAAEKTIDMSVRVRVALDGEPFWERESRDRIARDLL